MGGAVLMAASDGLGELRCASLVVEPASGVARLCGGDAFGRVALRRETTRGGAWTVVEGAHRGVVTSLRWMADGASLLSTSDDRSVKRWRCLEDGGLEPSRGRGVSLSLSLVDGDAGPNGVVLDTRPRVT